MTIVSIRHRQLDGFRKKECGGSPREDEDVVDGVNREEIPFIVLPTHRQIKAIVKEVVRDFVPRRERVVEG